MKQIKFINILLSMLLAVMFISCLSDGDETVSLEYGNPKKVIIGTWKVTKYTPGCGDFKFKSGTNLVFSNDGTFKSSSDDIIHKWVLGDYKNGEPYYGGIYFDDIYYDIISLGGDENGRHGHWVVGKPYDDGYDTEYDGYCDYVELEKDPSAVPDDIPDTDPEEPSGGFGKLVSKIYIAPKNSTNVIQTIKFYYDDTNRVTSIECSGTEEIIPNLKNGIRLYYQINDNTMTLYHTKENATKVRGDGNGSGYGYGTLNDMRYLEYDCLNNTQQTMNSPNQPKLSYGKYYYYEGETLGLNNVDYWWKNGDVQTGALYGTGREGYYHTNIENKANINLNRLFAHTYKCYDGNTYISYEDVYGLALCGYIGNKDKHLLSQIEGANAAKFSYTFDSDGYPNKIIYSPINLNGNVTYDFDCFIEYTTDIGFVLPIY